MVVEMACCTQALLRDIADKAQHQIDVAKTYALALRSSEQTDWATVNRAIVSRWSVGGLNRIKEMAWSGRCFR